MPGETFAAPLLNTTVIRAPLLQFAAMCQTEKRDVCVCYSQLCYFFSDRFASPEKGITFPSDRLR